MAKRYSEIAEQKETNSQPEKQSSMPAYLQAALRIPTSYPLGAPRVDTEVLGAGMPDRNLPAPVPGVLVYDYLPTLGTSYTTTSALNRAVYNEFNIIRSQISGNRPYEPADHMIYRMCVDGLRELYHYVRRIYLILKNYASTNLYRPEFIIQAMGLDYDDWYSNANALYQWLQNNQNALLPFPTVPIGTVSDRHVVYNQYLFSDGDIDSTQTYILKQAAFYSYETVDEVKGVTLRPAPTTYPEFVRMWNEMYAALQNSSDVYIIAADIRRAFGDRVVTSLPATGNDMTVEYIKLDPVLSSIMNATVIDVPTEQYSAFRIYDIPGEGLGCQPKVTNVISLQDDTPGKGTAINAHLNMVQSNPAEADILAAARLKPAIRIITDYDITNTGSTLTQEIYVDSMGTEVVVGARMTSMNSDGTASSNPIPSALIISNATGAAGSVQRDQAFLSHQMGAALSNFDWHAPLYVSMLLVANATSSLVHYGSFPYEDVQNYVPVTTANLKQIHDACLLAEFGF